jgi:hypothetical protein
MKLCSQSVNRQKGEVITTYVRELVDWSKTSVSNRIKMTVFIRYIIEVLGH